VSQYSGIEMYCEDLSTTKLMVIRGANGCGFSSGRAQCNSAAGSLAELLRFERDS